MIGGSDDVVVVRAGPRGVAAEDDMGTVELERVVKRVEYLRRDQLPRHEDIGSLERRRLQHLSRHRRGDFEIKFRRGRESNGK